MNIFVTDLCPRQSAINLCNKHVVKMLLESVQLLCGPFPEGTAPYRRTHFNHPSAIWTRASKQNYEWLFDHATALSDEYTWRYNNLHKCIPILNWCEDNYKTLNLPDIGLTTFALAMPPQYKTQDPVQSYRNYYIGDKARFAKWKRRNPPDWWPFDQKAIWE